MRSVCSRLFILLISNINYLNVIIKSRIGILLTRLFCTHIDYAAEYKRPGILSEVALVLALVLILVVILILVLVIVLILALILILVLVVLLILALVLCFVLITIHFYHTPFFVVF
jgi:hypothetical protein